jgi:hypothetical protein
LRHFQVDLDYDKEKLLKIYEQHKDRIKTYINREGGTSPIGVLLFDEKPDYILEMENKVNYLHNSYYLISSGYHPHVDDTRQCVISFELQNEHNIPLKFYEPEEEVYHDGPIMWNTSVWHGSDPSPTPRIFYQIELKDDKTFDFYLREYMSDNLFKY